MIPGRWFPRLRRKFADLPGRLMGLAMAPVLLFAVVWGGYVIHQRAQDLEARLAERSQLLARHLAAAADYGIFSGNRVALEVLVAAVAREQDIVFAAILDSEERLLAHAGTEPYLPGEDRTPGILFRLQTDDTASVQPIMAGRRLSVYPIRGTSLPVDDVQDAHSPKSPRTDPVRGYAVVGIDTLAARTELLQFVGLVMLMLAMVLLAGMVMARRLAQGIHRPVTAALLAARRIGRGEDGIRLDTGHGIATVDDLSESLNQMAIQLEASRRELENKINRATDALRQQVTAAENADRAKSRFLAAASHDLRQPMHALSLLVAAVRCETRLPERESLLQRIDAATNALSGLLDALLDISRLDSGKLVPEPELFDLAAFCQTITETHRAAADKKAIELLCRIRPAWVRTDRLWLERIVGNYLSNAIRYTPNNGRVMLALRRREGFSRLEVRDNGPGIPALQQAQIFQEFVQLHNPQRDRSEGLGLGLAIVERLAVRLGYPIGVSSSPGRGAVFWISLPPEAAPAISAAPQAGTLAAAPLAFAFEVQQPLAGVRLLIVEDDELVRESYQSLGLLWGAELIACGTAQQAIDQITTAGLPDIVIADYRLPGNETGLDLVAEIRQRAGVLIPAVIATGDTENPALRNIKIPALEVIFKPLRPAVLLRQLHNLRQQKSTGSDDGKIKN